eukprot:CAMPEP_0113382062 /NCGR_PEP_ID=MMETSP0013_2-20120614/5637_1 /TAXON_ID=2843 ORGANISM="Skeletonema costatum, Strain 1716" /NCGR_SAMPLE_ID=MMETSP0013_2 /ASSEMBLY_ACC=CAM_ASM_000158 /LENGTH=916 /DNA_ID=CAMNT_0000264535 /DNA_START=15 /DNA_END=2765 /DNA_ORIENTATION=+ /assembly_acc=CAM_ASM_000158
MSSNREIYGKDGGDKRDSFNEYDWVAAAKGASFSHGDDANDNSDAHRPNEKSKKGASSSASSAAAGSALSEISCDAVSIMEWATDLLSPSSSENNAQDVFAENPKESPLRHRRIPTPSRVRSMRQGNYPAEQRLPKNDLPGAQSKGFPHWEGTTITADARKSDEISVMTPFGGDAQRNYPMTALPNKHAASEPNSFGNWDQFEVSQWDSYPEQDHVSESEEGMNAIYKKRPIRPQTNKRKLMIWIGSIAVLLIVIIAIAVPLSTKSQNASATSGNENISTGSENDVTVPVESDSSPSQPATPPEIEPAITEDESFVNGQATTIPLESNPVTPPPVPNQSNNEPVSSPDSTVVESNPSPPPPVPNQNNNEPVSSPVVESNPAPPLPVPNQNNNEPVSSPVVESNPSPPPPVPNQNNNEPVSSPVVESNPTPPFEPAITEDESFINGQATTIPLESNPVTPPPVPNQNNNEPVSSPVSNVVESGPTPPPPPVPNQNNNEPVSSPVVEPNPTPPPPVPNQNNNEPVSSPVSNVVESNPTPPPPVPNQNNNEPVSPPVSNVVELSIQEEPASSPNNKPVESSSNQQGTGSNSIGVQPQPAPPANSQAVTVPNPPTTPNPTRMPTLPPTPSCIKVELKMDKFGHETSWVLKDVDRNRELASVPEDTYDANEEATQDFCGLESGKYKFIIRDKYGDGMCCGNGRGKYRVSLNGQQIIVGGYFKKELSFDILVGYDPGTLTEREYQYWVGHNKRRKEFHEKHGKEYVPLAWSHSLADRARAWATTLLGECDDVSMRHDPNRNGDGENMAKNLGSNPNSGLGQLYPVESIVTRWVEREMDWNWPENAHLTQALWRGSTYVGCADVEETKSDGSICRVQVCRYRRSGNCNMGSFGGDWLSAMLQDETNCGELCPAEGCYVSSFLT